MVNLNVADPKSMSLTLVSRMRLTLRLVAGQYSLCQSVLTNRMFSGFRSVWVRWLSCRN